MGDLLLTSGELKTEGFGSRGQALFGIQKATRNDRFADIETLPGGADPAAAELHQNPDRSGMAYHYILFMTLNIQT
jgi:hypothetical protein